MIPATALLCILCYPHHTKQPSQPSLSSPLSTVQSQARKQGHLGHRKTWYHSQVERQGRRRLSMVVGIIAHERTWGGACSKVCHKGTCGRPSSNIGIARR